MTRADVQAAGATTESDIELRAVCYPIEYLPAALA
jgi:hypothetical protein